MGKLEGTKTARNLISAFAGESQARNRYTFAAEQARKEGNNAIALIFEETAVNEKAHAEEWMEALAEGLDQFTGVDAADDFANFPVVLGTTEENLKGAAMGEGDEATHMYPTMAKEAEEEGFQKIADKFRRVGEVEARHQKRYQKYLELLETGTLFERDGEVYWRCSNCGYTVKAKAAPNKCPICEKPQGWFQAVEDHE